MCRHWGASEAVWHTARNSVSLSNCVEPGKERVLQELRGCVRDRRDAPVWRAGEAFLKRERMACPGRRTDMTVRGVWAALTLT